MAAVLWFTPYNILALTIEDLYRVVDYIGEVAMKALLRREEYNVQQGNCPSILAYSVIPYNY